MTITIRLVELVEYHTTKRRFFFSAFSSLLFDLPFVSTTGCSSCTLYHHSIPFTHLDFHFML